MSKRQSKGEEVKKEFEAKPEEFARLRKMLAEFHQDFDKVMCVWGYAFLRDDQLWVRDPDMFHFWSQVHAIIEMEDYRASERLLEAFPAEREKLLAKIKAMGADFKNPRTESELSPPEPSSETEEEVF